MKSITLHGLDNKLYERIKEKAQRQGLSLNKTIKNLLEKSLGIKNHDGADHREDFIEFCGVWTEAEAKEFAGVIEDFEKIDPRDWQ
jgi:hypothetical protein